MTAEAVTSPFEPIVLEDDPAFNVEKEYQDELDYYYETHPEDHGYIPPKSLKESAVSMLGGIRSGIGKAIELRDELYGYNDQTKGPRIHLKPVNEMKFLPDGMDQGTDMFSFGGGVAPDFSLQGPVRAKPARENPPCHKKKKSKKFSCCSCRDTSCLDNPRHCKREEREKDTSSPADDILSMDPFGIGPKKRG